MRSSTTFTVILFIALVFIPGACSGGKSPLEPSTNNAWHEQSPATSSENRSIVAVYETTIDPVSKTFAIEPVERSSQAHIPLSKFYPNVLDVTGYGFTPDFWADIKLIHPYPGSGVDGFDARVIAIVPMAAGNNYYYPEAGIYGNKNIVLQPDGYTTIFDSLGIGILGNANPFKAYFKDHPNRVWSSTGLTEETQTWQLNLSAFGGVIKFKLVVDVSTNFPQPPQPGIDNAPEPVELDASVGSGLTNAGGATSIMVTLLDWQEQADIGHVQIEAPELFTGVVDLSYSTAGPNPNEYIYTGVIANSLMAPVGDYQVLISASDQATSIHLYDMFTVSVIDATMGGNLIWAKRAGGVSYEGGQGITSLSDNSSVICGHFIGSTTFGPGEINETTLTTVGQYDAFVARYDQYGSLIWATSGGGPQFEYCYGLTSLSDDSVVIGGYFEVSAIFGLGEPNETYLESAGLEDVFLARYNPDGSLAWAKRAGGDDRDQVWGITTLWDDSIVVSGHFQGESTFGPGESNETTLSSTGQLDIYVAKFNPDGTLVWAKSAQGTGFDRGMGITALSDGSTVSTGYFAATCVFGEDEPNETTLIAPGNGYDVFMVKYNPDGTLDWAKNAGGDMSDFGSQVTTLSDDSTVVTGHFCYIQGGTATFGLGEPNEITLTSDGKGDIFVARYNTDGTLAWAKRAGGTNADFGFGMATLIGDAVVVTGSFMGSANFGQGELNETVLVSAGGNDNFIARYNINGELDWVKRSGSGNTDNSAGVAVLSDNTIVHTGAFRETATFGPGEPNETILIPDGLYDIYIARYEP